MPVMYSGLVSVTCPRHDVRGRLRPGAELREKPKGPRSGLGITGEGKAGNGATNRKSLMMPRHMTSRAGMQYRGDKGRAAVRRQAAVMEDTRPCGHRRPRGIEGARPGRISRVRNMETPSGSGARCAGKPTVRRGRIPWREQDAREAKAGGRKAAGNRDDMTGSSRRRFPDNWPDTGPGARAAKAALTWAGEPLTTSG